MFAINESHRLGNRHSTAPARTRPAGISGEARVHGTLATDFCGWHGTRIDAVVNKRTLRILPHQRNETAINNNSYWHAVIAYELDAAIGICMSDFRSVNVSSKLLRNVRFHVGCRRSIPMSKCYISLYGVRRRVGFARTQQDDRDKHNRSRKSHRDYSSSPKSGGCSGARAGDGSPRCTYACPVTMRPRGVRWMKPCWIR